MFIAIHLLGALALPVSVHEDPSCQGDASTTPPWRYRLDGLSQFGTSRTLEQVTRAPASQGIQYMIAVIMLAED